MQEFRPEEFSKVARGLAKVQGERVPREQASTVEAREVRAGELAGVPSTAHPCPKPPWE